MKSVNSMEKIQLIFMKNINLLPSLRKNLRHIGNPAECHCFQEVQAVFSRYILRHYNRDY